MFHWNCEVFFCHTVFLHNKKMLVFNSSDYSCDLIFRGARRKSFDRFPAQKKKEKIAKQTNLPYLVLENDLGSVSVLHLHSRSCHGFEYMQQVCLTSSSFFFLLRPRWRVLPNCWRDAAPFLLSLLFLALTILLSLTSFLVEDLPLFICAAVPHIFSYTFLGIFSFVAFFRIIHFLRRLSTKLFFYAFSIPIGVIWSLFFTVFIIFMIG